MATQNIIFFERLMQGFDTLFDYTFQEGPKLKFFNINIIQSEYGISIDQTDNIIDNIIQIYWGTNKKDEVKFQKSLFPLYTSLEKELFMTTPLIVE